MPIYVFLILLTLNGSAANARAQSTQRPPDTINLSGPRIGATFLSNGVRGKLGDMGANVGSVITQFGWQHEKRFLTSPDGFTGVTEFVFLLGGMDQNVVLPSLNWMVGARTAKGIEFAIGPNISPGGMAMAAAAGVTFRTGNLNIPVNLAVVPSKSGVRVSLLGGFNMRNR